MKQNRKRTNTSLPRVISIFFILMLFAQAGWAQLSTCDAIPGFIKLGEHNGHGYYMSETSVPWAQAKTLAENVGGYLATMNDQAENDYLKSSIGNIMAFIGYNDAGTEGTGQWANNEPVTLDLSYSNSAENDYAVMNFWAGTWQMVNQWVYKHFVMEMDCGGGSSGTSDLTVQIVNLPDSISQLTTPINVKVSNTGSAVAGSFTVRLYAKEGGNPFFLLGEETVTSMGVGDLNYIFNYTVSQDLSTSSFVFKAVVDEDDLIAELDETNNVSEMHLSAVISSVQTLSINCPSAFPFSGDALVAELTVTNQGSTVSLPREFRLGQGSLGAGNYQSYSVFSGGFSVPSMQPGETIVVTKNFGPWSAGGIPGYRAHFTGINSYSDQIDVLDGFYEPTGTFFDYYCQKVHSDLSVTVNTNNVFDENGVLDYEIVITNNGVEDIPNVVTFVARSSYSHYLSDLTYSDGNIFYGTNEDKYWHVPNIPVGESRTMQVHATIQGTLPDTFMVDIQTGSGHLIDADTTNNDFSLAFTLQGVVGCGVIAGFTKLGEHNGHGYYMSDASTNWTQAKTLAENAGGYLATMNDQAENDFLKSKLNNNMVFIGYNDAGTEGAGQWANNEPVTLDLSYSNSAENDYAVMNFWAGTWQMVNQYVYKPFVMEMDCGGTTGGSQPDLTVSNITNLPSQAMAGTQVDFNFDLNNIGNATATGAYTIGMYLSSDQSFSVDDALVGEVPTGGTPVGTIAAVPAAIAIPANAANGAYYLLLIADTGNTIAESNENNNMVTAPIAVGASTGGGCSATIAGFTKLGEYNGHGYYLSDAPTNWAQAKTLAENAGGYLATMNDQAENDYLKSNIGNEMVFIGYNDAATEGVGSWATNEPVTLDLSYSNSAENDYGVMNFWAGTWQMVNQFVAKKYVMEMNCSTPQPAPIVLTPKTLVGTEIQGVYPNPVMDNFTLRVVSVDEKETSFNIYDARGQRLLSEKKYLPQGVSEVDFDVSELPAGMYFVKAEGMNAYHNFVIIR